MVKINSEFVLKVEEIEVNNKLRKSSTDRAISCVCGVSFLRVRIILMFLPINILIYLILANTLSDSPAPI